MMIDEITTIRNSTNMYVPFYLKEIKPNYLKTITTDYLFRVVLFKVFNIILTSTLPNKC